MLFGQKHRQVDSSISLPGGTGFWRTFTFARLRVKRPWNEAMDWLTDFFALAF